jgi:hypothetical protein
MKRTLIIVPALALVFASSAHAETEVKATTATKTAIDRKKEALKEAQEKFRAEVESKKEDIKRAVEIKKTEVKIVKGEFRAEKAKGIVDRAISQLSRTVDRLTKIADRIASRIAKVKAEGGNTAEAEAKLALARTDLLTARAQITAIGNLDLSVASGTASTTIKANFEKVKAASDAVKITLKSAKTNLMLSTRSIKSANATSTATTTKSN